METISFLLLIGMFSLIPTSLPFLLTLTLVEVWRKVRDVYRIDGAGVEAFWATLAASGEVAGWMLFLWNIPE